MRESRKSLTLISVALLALLVLACGDEGPTDQGGPSAADLTWQGWDRFETGEYSQARTKFNEAIQRDAGYAEAYNGLGWTAMKLLAYQDALTAFERAVARDVNSTDPLVGMALLHRDFKGGDLDKVIALAAQALERSPRYRFSHDRSLDWRDLHLLLAQAYFGRSEYDLANEQVAELGGNVLDPASDSFVSDLLAEIERLGELLRG